MTLNKLKNAIFDFSVFLLTLGLTVAIIRFVFFICKYIWITTGEFLKQIFC